MKNTVTILLLGLLQNANAQQLQIGSNTSWKSDAATYVVLDNLNLQYDAPTGLLSNTFKFTGNTNSYINGDELPIIRGVEVAKTSGAKLILNRDFNLTGPFTFTNGLVDLNGFTIFMGTNALLTNENENSRLAGTDGYARIIANLNAPNAVNPGNLGAVITSSQNLGSTYVFRGVKSQINGNGLGSSILRYYDIVPTNNTGLNATLRINYFDAELNSLPENSLVLWKSADNVNWSVQGYSSSDAIANFVEKTGIADFSRWTLSTPNNPLPIQFILFNASCQNGMVQLTWKTAQEQNTAYFEIERSNDGSRFFSIGTLPAAGNSSSEKSYTYVDNSFSSGNGFYRIKEVDADGKYIYTAINRLNCGSSNEEMMLWPNPVEQIVNVSITSQENTTGVIKLVDSKGATVYLRSAGLLKGNNILQINMTKFPAGIYAVRFSFGNGMENKNRMLLKK